MSQEAIRFVGTCDGRRSTKLGTDTVPRYANWANTVRDNMIAAMCETDEIEQTGMMTRAVTSLRAFSEIKTFYDDLNK